MKNKGFTLIELLAVIIILAIIALIATPIILGIIEDTRESAKVNSAQFVIDGVQTAYGIAYSKSYGTDKLAGQTPTVEQVKNELQFKNATPSEVKDNKFSVTTKDNVTCTFERDSEDQKLKLASDKCGLGNKVTEAEEVVIGTVK